MGLATARALAEHGVSVHGVAFAAGEPGRYSRACSRVFDLHGLIDDAERVVGWLKEHSADLTPRPVVFATSDGLALTLARHRDVLSRTCRFAQNDLEALEALVSKDKLYAVAARAGLRVPSSLVSPSIDELDSWTRSQPGPYLIKPYYAGGVNALGRKNLTLPDALALRRFIDARSEGGRDLIFQPVLRGGDGWVFDCYGLCDAAGRVRVLASHRRLRQAPADFGMTCLGEIPAAPPQGEERLFALTRALFEATPYHGIFGVEWLHDHANGELVLLDVNARPFWTIGHLKDCGLNLPYLAYRELCDDLPPVLDERPELRRRLWLDFWRDLAAIRHRIRGGQVGVVDWLRSIAACRSFALWSARDPLPAMARAFSMASLLVRGGESSGEAPPQPETSSPGEEEKAHLESEE